MGSFENVSQSFKALLARHEAINNFAYSGNYASGSFDPGFAVVPGDPTIITFHDNPDFFNEASTYNLAIVQSGVNGTVLTWTYPHFDPSVTGVKFLVQRSTSSLTTPNGDTYITYGDHHVGTRPPPDPNWTTIHDFGGTNVGSYPSTFTDASPANPNFNYRLAIVFNSTSEGGAFGEIDWNVVSAIKSFTLNGANANNQTNLNWTAPSQATSFSLYRSTTPGTWGSPIQTLGASARSATDNTTGLTFPLYYHLVGHLANGLSIPYNDFSLSSVVPGSLLLAKVLGGTGNDGATAVAVDASGNFIVTGYFQGSVNFGGGVLTSAGGYDMFLAKYTKDGNFVWANRYGSTGDENPTCIALDDSGNILVGGYITGTANVGGSNLVSHGSQDAFVAKYSSTGVHQWSVGFGGIVSDSTTAIAADSLGNVFVTGWYQSDLNVVDIGNLQLPRSWGQADTFLAKFSPSGTTLWAKNFYNGSADYGRGVAVDKRINPNTGTPYNNVILGGYFNGNINLGGGQFDSNWFTTPGGYLAKFDTDGTHIWSKRYGGSATVTRFWAMAMDSIGDIVVSGDFSQNTDLGGGNITASSYGVDLFVAKFSGVDGAYRWATPIPGAGATLAQETSMTTDGQGNIFVTGNYQGKYTFGTQSIVSSGGITDGFIAKFTGAGVAVWAKGFGGSGYSSGNYVVADAFGNCVVAGYFSGSVSISTPPSNGVGGYDGLVLRLSP